MTALCGGGPSGVQPGVDAVISLGAIGIATFITTKMGLPDVAPVLAPIVAGLIDLVPSVYCATDPPADPGLTAADVLTAVEVPPTASTFAAQQKIVQWFESQYWWSICHCTGTTTPAPPTPSNPGPIQSNPGIPANSATPCWNVIVPWSAPARGTSTGPAYTDLTSVGLPPGTLYSGVIASSPVTVNNQFVALPPDISRMALTITLDQPVSGSGLYVQAQWLEAQDIPPTIIGEIFDVIMIPVGTSTPFATVTTYPSYVKLSGLVVVNGDNIAHSGTLAVTFYCGSTTVGNQPCCAPDPLLEGELQQILQYVQAIYASLGIPLSSFAEGAAHTSLTGTGTIALNTADVAVKINLTSIQPWVPRSAGNPIRYFEAGHLVFTTSEGAATTLGIRYAEQVFNIPQLGYTLDYNIGDGVVATITELTPGP